MRDWNSTPFRPKLVSRWKTRSKPLLCAVFALAALALEVKRPDIVQGALDAGESVSSGIFGLIASGLCVFAIRRSVLRALPGLMLTVLYWVLLVVVLRR